MVCETRQKVFGASECLGFITFTNNWRAVTPLENCRKTGANVGLGAWILRAEVPLLCCSSLWDSFKEPWGDVSHIGHVGVPF